MFFQIKTHIKNVHYFLFEYIFFITQFFFLQSTKMSTKNGQTVQHSANRTKITKTIAETPRVVCKTVATGGLNAVVNNFC